MARPVNPPKFGIPDSRIREWVRGRCGLRPEERITEGHLKAHVWWWRMLPEVWKHREALSEVSDLIDVKDGQYLPADEEKALSRFLKKSGMRQWTNPVPFMVAVNFSVVAGMKYGPGLLEAYLLHWSKIEFLARRKRAPDWIPACHFALPVEAFREQFIWRDFSGAVFDLRSPDDVLIQSFLLHVKKARLDSGKSIKVRNRQRSSQSVAYLENGPQMDPQQTARKFMFNEAETIDRIAYLNGSGTTADERDNATRKITAMIQEA